MKSKGFVATLAGLGILFLGVGCGAERSEPQNDGSSDTGYEGTYEGEEYEYNPLSYYEVETPQGSVGCIVYDGSAMTCNW